MNELIQNWFILFAFICLGIVFGALFYKFIKLPTQEKVKHFKKALCVFVEKAELEIGSKKGSEKLNYVWKQMCDMFPFITTFMNFETFKTLVNGALFEVGIWSKK